MSELCPKQEVRHVAETVQDTLEQADETVHYGIVRF